VPSINTYEELASVLREVQAFDNEGDLQQSLNELRSITGTDQIGVGIKNVLSNVETAKESEESRDNLPSKLAELIAQQMASSRL
jgi:vesicle-fusing ATPase